ncbi:MAG: hypothetical protein WD602_02165 [Actinomycetota bacterium]
MNLELERTRILKSLAERLHASVPMLAVAAFIAVTFIASAAFTSRDAFAAESIEPYVQEAAVGPVVGAGGVSQETGAAGGLESIVVKVAPAPAVAEPVSGIAQEPGN